MLESYRELQQKPKTVSEFKNALQFIWFTSPEKPTTFERPPLATAASAACVSANGRHVMIH